MVAVAESVYEHACCPDAGCQLLQHWLHPVSGRLAQCADACTDCALSGRSCYFDCRAGPPVPHGSDVLFAPVHDPVHPVLGLDNPAFSRCSSSGTRRFCPLGHRGKAADFHRPPCQYRHYRRGVSRLSSRYGSVDQILLQPCRHFGRHHADGAGAVGCGLCLCGGRSGKEQGPGVHRGRCGTGSFELWPCIWLINGGRSFAVC